MSAARLVVQLVRAHYGGQDTTFRAAAEALARGSKDARMKEALFDAIRGAASRAPTAPQQLKPLVPAPIVNELLTRIELMSLAELMLDPELQRALDELVLELQHTEELAERGLRPRNRLLFHGPPGNGKTSAAGALAREIGIYGYSVSVAEIASKWVSGTSENLTKLFKSLTPSTLIVLDEIDAIGTRRGGAETSAGKEQSAIVNSLLVLMDRHRDGVLVATTNRPELLDEALLRRFEEHILFPEPNQQQKVALASRLCAKHDVPVINVRDCNNFDEVTKCCLTHARRHVMQEILGINPGEQQEEHGYEEKESVH